MGNKCRFCHNRNHGITSVKCASLEKGKRIDIAREYVHLMIIILAAVTIQIMIPTAVTIPIMIMTAMAVKIFLSEKKNTFTGYQMIGQSKVSSVTMKNKCKLTQVQDEM